MFRLVAGKGDGTVELLDAKSPNLGLVSLTVLEAHYARVASLDISLDGTRITTCSGRVVKVSCTHCSRDNPASGAFSSQFGCVNVRLSQLWLGEPGPRSDLVWRNVGGHDGGAIGSPERGAGGGGKEKGHTADVRSVAFNSIGTMAATCGADNQVIVWDTQTGRPTVSIAGHTAEVNYCCFQPGEDLLCTASNDMTCKVRPCGGGDWARVNGLN